MRCPQGITRVILVVLDGLRPEAIGRYGLRHIAEIVGCGAHTLEATTVEPSITTAALTSLMTGVSPAIHRIRSDHFILPRPTEPLTTLTSLLHEHKIPTWGYLAGLARPFRGLGERIASRMGATVTFAGETAPAILANAEAMLLGQQQGLFFLHWPDADRAGHAEGWMSPAYGEAARTMDDALGRLMLLTQVRDDPATVLIALADHGGGGIDAKEHCSRHRHDVTIPILMTGGQVRTTQLRPGTSLLDIPATVPWLLGIPVPSNYSGKILSDAILSRRDPVAA